MSHPRNVIFPALPLRAAGGLIAVAILLSSSAAFSEGATRGDANSDLKLDISDPIYVLNYLFSGGAKPRCVPVADTNADRKVDISDAVAALTYLFTGRGELLPLTTEELALCDEMPMPKVLRTGRLIDPLEPGHDIDGRAEQLANRVIRLRDFSYNGKGDPQVVVLLTKEIFANKGIIVSPDLRRDHPYDKETLEFALPEGVTSEDFEFVAIWCDAFPLTFAYAELITLP